MAATMRNGRGQRVLAFVLALLLTSIGSGHAMAGDIDDPLSPYLWQARLLVMFAKDGTDERLTEQTRVLSGMGSGAAERDLVLLTVLASDRNSASLRARLGVGPDAPFAVVLVGKDGGAKRVSAAPIEAADLARTIDAMPMRRDEMQRG